MPIYENPNHFQVSVTKGSSIFYIQPFNQRQLGRRVNIPSGSMFEIELTEQQGAECIACGSLRLKSAPVVMGVDVASTPSITPAEPVSEPIESVPVVTSGLAIVEGSEPATPITFTVSDTVTVPVAVIAPAYGVARAVGSVESAITSVTETEEDDTEDEDLEDDTEVETVDATDETDAIVKPVDVPSQDKPSTKPVQGARGRFQPRHK